MALLGFAKSEAVIFNKAWFEAGGEEAMFQDVTQGTGPFMWEPGQTVGVDTQRFERNPNYFKGDGALPYLDNLVMFGILDESAHQGDFHWVRNWGPVRRLRKPRPDYDGDPGHPEPLPLLYEQPQ